MADPFWLPVHEIRMRPVLPCGMSYLLVGALAYTLRTTHDPVTPVEVRQEGGGWVLVEGRHRWVAHLVAGRDQIQCVEVDG